MEATVPNRAHARKRRTHFYTSSTVFANFKGTWSDSLVWVNAEWWYCVRWTDTHSMVGFINTGTIVETCHSNAVVYVGTVWSSKARRAVALIGTKLKR